MRAAVVVLLGALCLFGLVAIVFVSTLFFIPAKKFDIKKEEEEEERKRTKAVVDTFVLPPLKSAPAKTVTLESRTIDGQKISVQAHSRLAGGIWSFTVGGKPYVTELYGNGGSLQYACFANVDGVNNNRDHSESYNPTQAGNARDKNGSTTSRWYDVAIDSKKNMVFSRTQMAFYTDPSNPHENVRDGGLVPVFNTRAISDFVLEQFLHLGYADMPNVLHARYVLNVPEKLVDHKHANEVTWLIAEMPTGYMHADFTRHLLWNSVDKIFQPLPGDTGSNVESRPVLGGAVATPDGRHCMGIRCIKYLPRRINIPRFSVSEASDGPNPMHQKVTLNKWALTTSLGGEKRHFHGPITTEILMVVGTLDHVTETFKKLGL